VSARHPIFRDMTAVMWAQLRHDYRPAHRSISLVREIRAEGSVWREGSMGHDESPVRIDETAAAPGSSRGREHEWGRRFAALTLGWLGAETLSGLALWLLPFSVPAQWTVVVHTVAGVVLLAPEYCAACLKQC
jgi:hypothetical protein